MTDRIIYSNIPRNIIYQFIFFNAISEPIDRVTNIKFAKSKNFSANIFLWFLFILKYYHIYINLSRRGGKIK